MNKDAFLRYIENSRDCEKSALDRAVSAGLRKAKNDRFDAKKICALAAAAVFTCAVFFAANPRPFEAAAARYYRSRNHAMPGSAETLSRYAKLIAAGAGRYSGGK